MRIKKENIMPIVVLVAISVIVAALLGVTNIFTAERIEENKEKEVRDSLYEVLPEASGFEKLDLSKIENVPETVKDAYADNGGLGYVVVLETSTSYTSGDKMSISVGISKDLKIVGIRVNAYSETKDFGQKTYPKKFIGLENEDVDLANKELLVSGVTYSSKAFKAAVKDALNIAAALGDIVDISGAEATAATVIAKEVV